MTEGDILSSDRDVQAGTVVFAGTRVPLKNLIDYLDAGDSLEEFLDDFPSVTRARAVAALELGRDALAALLVAGTANDARRRFERVLAKVPDVEPDDGDRLVPAIELQKDDSSGESR